MSLSPAPTGELERLAEARFWASVAAPDQFFEAEAEHISEACLAMARRFHRGGRLLAFGAGKAVTDALHVSVEFVHPVIVGKRALPAIALGADLGSTLGLVSAGAGQAVYAEQIAALGRSDDIAMGIDPTGVDPAVRAGLQAAAAQGLLTISLAAAGSGAPPHVDFAFAVEADDPAVIQETHETLYHILWELVHVFFEHPSLLAAAVETVPVKESVYGSD